MSKFEVKKTRRIGAPVRMIVHGPPGIGKSNFAASAPSPIFIAAEDGLEEIDAAAVEPHPKTYEDVCDALDYVATLDHQTVIVDSLDWLEPLVWDYTVRRAKAAKVKGSAMWSNIEDFGYGKGYLAAIDHWRVIIRKLEFLRAKGMNVILIAHSKRATIKNPIGDDYEQNTLKLNEKATALFVEWARIIAYFELDIATEDSSGRTKAQTTGRRIIRTETSPSFLAKIRTEKEFPAKLPLERRRGWDVFAKALADAGDEADEATMISLTQRLEERIRDLGDTEVESKVRDFIKTQGPTASALNEAIERLDITITERRKAS